MNFLMKIDNGRLSMKSLNEIDFLVITKNT